METALTFDDVTMVPQLSDVVSRNDTSLITHLTKNTQIKIPIVCANMDTTIGDEMAEELLKNGTYPIFHRFTTFEKQAEWVEKYKNKCYISCGLGNLEQTFKLLALGAKGVCIDIAHGHTSNMISTIKHIKNRFPEMEVIAGNVCTSVGVSDLINAGADAVKCGVGPGSCCTTRMITGFGVPQFSTIKECATVAHKHGIPLIADGGIRGSSDIAKSLAAGASCVMIGGLFAKTFESAAPKIKIDGKMFSKYRGQASEEFQKDFYGAMKKGTVAEGVAFKVECTESVQELINKLCGGLRSSLTYGGAKNILEFQKKVEFRIVTQNYIKESKPRPNIIS